MPLSADMNGERKQSQERKILVKNETKCLQWFGYVFGMILKEAMYTTKDLKSPNI